jgi:hypothetical protein
VGLEALLAAQRRGHQAGSLPAAAGAAAACSAVPSSQPSTLAAGAAHIGGAADGTDSSSSNMAALTNEFGQAPPQQQAAHNAGMRTGPTRRQVAAGPRPGAATLLQRLIGGCFSGGGQTSVAERASA